MLQELCAYLENNHKRFDFEIHHPELVTVEEFRSGSYLGQYIHPPASSPECKLTQDIPQSEGQSAAGHYLIAIKRIQRRDFLAQGSRRELAGGLLESFTFSLHFVLKAFKG